MNHEDALRKAMACLRLAKSSNPQEAALAAAKAQEIITRYGLDVNSADFDQQEKIRDEEPINDYGHSDPLDTVERVHRGWTLRLVSAVSRVNGCRCYHSTNVDGKGGKRLMVVGRPSDVQTVRYLYGFFKNETIRLCDANTKGNSGAYKNHYRIGVTDAIIANLYEQKETSQKEVRTENTGNATALMRVNNAVAKQQQRDLAVERALNKLLYGKEEPTKTRTAHPSGYAKTYTGGRAHGRRDGANIKTQSKGSLGSGRLAIGGAK